MSLILSLIKELWKITLETKKKNTMLGLLTVLTSLKFQVHWPLLLS